ncbi:hypothetical protein F2Q70_00020854 [Brassica cretica]|uniref:Uncharacterized protein n=2 Tax=Brassica cretica TaxID=69181 RepID=A0A8S9HF20_BRACR|nr:hypothetical protein F2Q70_00020854 [Brassica cretica]KAF2554498.1 hypothetical protein F2Q68_00014301 [Brassica cretica]KAF3605362.1 hypothetical protein DY000_02046779 [Brassica cretica]
MAVEMAIGLYRPALSRPAAVHGECGSWRYRPARDAVTRSAIQSRPIVAKEKMKKEDETEKRLFLD